MKWRLPAKTFLLGEYAAITGGPAIMLTTHPCFELSLSKEPGLHGIHPLSPAGRWWHQQSLPHIGLQWSDPYQGLGGMGASSAQFLGVYLATQVIQQNNVSSEKMLDDYLSVAWDGVGARPSGYDVLAQSSHDCVFIAQQRIQCTYSWFFADIDFILVHTKQKLATHQHLQTFTPSNQIQQLIDIVNSAQMAFELKNSTLLVDAVNDYHQQLLRMHLVAEHTLRYINLFQKHPDVLAIKGCGAMGADVLLFLISSNQVDTFMHELTRIGWSILTTSRGLYTQIQEDINNLSKNA